LEVNQVGVGIKLNMGPNRFVGVDPFIKLSNKMRLIFLNRPILEATLRFSQHFVNMFIIWLVPIALQGNSGSFWVFELERKPIKVRLLFRATYLFLVQIQSLTVAQKHDLLAVKPLLKGSILEFTIDVLSLGAPSNVNINHFIFKGGECVVNT